MDTSLLTSSTNAVQTPLTGTKKVVRHFVNWLELYWWLPLSIVAVIGAAKFVMFMVGRRPMESPEWIVGLSFRVVACVVAIVLTSVYKQQIGLWISKEEQKLHIPLAIANKVETVVIVLAFIYVLLH